MYDALAEIFVCALAIAYLVLFAVLAMYWLRNLNGPPKKPAVPPPSAPGRAKL